MSLLEDVTWSAGQAGMAWLADQLGDPAANQVTSVVPAGFEAYARVLHPAADAAPGGRRLVRWRDVATWSRRTLEPDAPFHAVAFPLEPVASAPPWSGEGPRRGSLPEADAAALAAALRRHTRSPEHCWFCLPEGDGPAVELPAPSSTLARGPVEHALALAPRAGTQVGALWWPEDRAWCVASWAELAWTYVGGSAALVRALLGDPSLEAVEVAPDGPVATVDPWVAALVRPAADSLLTDGRATLETPLGSVTAELRRPHRPGAASLRYDAASVLGTRSSAAHTLDDPDRDEAALLLRVTAALTEAVIGLTGG